MCVLCVNYIVLWLLNFSSRVALVARLPPTFCRKSLKLTRRSCLEGWNWIQPRRKRASSGVYVPEDTHRREKERIEFLTDARVSLIWRERPQKCAAGVLFLNFSLELLFDEGVGFTVGGVTPFPGKIFTLASWEGQLLIFKTVAKKRFLCCDANLNFALMCYYKWIFVGTCSIIIATHLVCIYLSNHQFDAYT